MITLTDLAYARSGAADLGKAGRLRHDVVGLELAAPTEDGVAHLRADGRHHCLALVEGRSGVIASGFCVADIDALEAAETALERAGFTVTRGSVEAARSRRVRAFVGFDDPFGNRIELVCQQESVTRPVAYTRPAGITEFGHLRLDAPDVHAGLVAGPTRRSVSAGLVRVRLDAPCRRAWWQVRLDAPCRRAWWRVRRRVGGPGGGVRRPSGRAG